MTRKTKRKYNHYTDDFRRGAVCRSDAPDTTTAEVARELGIHLGQIYNWQRQYRRLSDTNYATLRLRRTALSLGLRIYKFEKIKWVEE